MLFDFMRQVMSRLDTIQKKVEVTQQNLDKLVRKMDKKKVCVNGAILSIIFN